MEHSHDTKINSRVALLVALAATFMAICNIKDGNIVQAMSQAQAHAISAWSYFEAKSTKQSITENSLELIRLQNPAAVDVIKSYEAKIGVYEKEKNEIKVQAKDFEKDYDDINVFDDQFDMTEAFLSLAIAMFGITALTQKKWLLYFGGSISFIGFVLGLCAFLKISLHSDFISKVLG